MILDIEVTEHDIACGESRGRKSCPVALAIRRELRFLGFDGHWVSVNNNYVVVSLDDGEQVFAKTSPIMRQFIGHFDAETNEAVPFSARLRFAPPR